MATPGANTRADAAVSLDIGSVRLFERHVTSDPPAPAELERVDADIDAALSSRAFAGALARRSWASPAR